MFSPSRPIALRYIVIFVLITALQGCAMPSMAHSMPMLIMPRTVSMNGSLVVPDGRPCKGSIDHAKSPEDDFVQFWVRDSWYVEDFALHPFFLVYDKKTNEWEQWEVWGGDAFGYYTEQHPATRQYSDGREHEPITFTHRQIGCVRSLSPITYIDERPSECLAAEWTGEHARRLIAVLRRPETYPYHHRYMIWPGPNSNGYARWVLDQADLGIDFHPKMVGKDWYGPLGFGVGLTPSRTGLHLDLLGTGAAVGLKDGVELHLLGLTFGIDLWPPAIKTPLGRLGLHE